MSTKERLDMEREDRHHESTLARLGGRGKFVCCHRCGSIDGMQIVHRETLEEMKTSEVAALAWYLVPWEPHYLFCTCSHCNRDKTIPGGYEPIALSNILAWLNTDPTQPDYAVLAETEPVLASRDSRESAGL